MGRKNDVEAVITSFHQESMIYEAVHSLCCQTIMPKRIIIVDDGTTDEKSLHVLDEIEADARIPVPLWIIRQSNSGVSAARNTGIRKTEAPLVVVLDGDDSLEPSFIEETREMLYKNPTMVAASSWLHTFGILEADVRPTGGGIAAFLSRNCCPATHMFRREVWEQCGGYDETMRSGFEDWDFFLNMLEAVPNTSIGIVKKPLVNYRTVCDSSNIKSMEKRLELMRYLIEKHKPIYKEHITDAVLGIEAISTARLNGWENEIIHAKLNNNSLCSLSNTFLESPSYGDGGMAAAVRIVSAYKQ
ncbi:MAG: glycosyltransferase family 2 protein [Eubacterium sp.]|nr:glycosyltransferase family 2 protein [Eubacterium sp.]